MRCLLGLLLAQAAAAQMCLPPRDMRPSGVVDGVLADAGCRASDGTYYASFRLTLPAPGRLTLSAAGTPSVALRLAVRDAQGRAVASGNPLTQSLSAGQYTVVAGAAALNQGGAFSLTSAFVPEPNSWCRAFPLLAPGQTLKGLLDSSSCRLPDGSRYDQFALRLFGAGTVEITAESKAFAPEVLLRAGTGRLLAPGAAKVSFDIGAADDYQVVVAAPDGAAAGEYQLSVRYSALASESCKVRQTLDPAVQISAQLGTGDCAPANGDSVFAIYELAPAGTGIATVEAVSAGFDPALVLQDAAGNVLATDASIASAGRAQIRFQLSAGTYRLLAAGRPPGGAFSLQYTFTPGLPEICPVLQLDANAVGNGTLSRSGSCRTERGMADSYRIVLPSAGTLEAALASSDFDARLSIRDEQDNRIVEAGNNGAGPSALIAADLPAGTYILEAASDLSPGGYAIAWKGTPKAPAPCPQTFRIAPNGGYINVLSDASCRGSNGIAKDNYDFTIPSDGFVALAVTSQAFAQEITLEGPPGSVLLRDRGGLDGSNSLVLKYLSAGNYRVGVQPVTPGGGGRYRADLLFQAGSRPPGCAPRQTLAPGGSVSGQLSFPSCDFPGGVFADVYQLPAATGSKISISLKSRDFDPVLEVYDGRGNLVAADDDSGGGTASLISLDLALVEGSSPSVYSVVIRPFSGYSIGKYDVIVR